MPIAIMFIIIWDNFELKSPLRFDQNMSFHSALVLTSIRQLARRLAKCQLEKILVFNV